MNDGKNIISDLGSFGYRGSLGMLGSIDIGL